MDLAVVFISSPYVIVYPWTGSFGVKYSDPATLPGGPSYGVAFSHAGDAIAVAHSLTPAITVYPWSAGFGAKYSNPATLPGGAGLGVDFRPGDDAIAVVSNNTPYIDVYAWSAGFGTKYSDPATLPPDVSRGVSWSPSGDAIAVAHDSSPYISVYPWNAGFGAKYSDPATLLSGNGTGVKFSPSGTSIGISNIGDPSVSIYPWSAGFGTRYTDAAVPPDPNGSAIDFRVGDTSTTIGSLGVFFYPGIAAYPWSPGFGTRYDDPIGIPSDPEAGSSVFAVAWNNPVGDSLAIGHSGSPFISVYPWSDGSGFGTKVSDPSVLPSFDVHGIAWTGGEVVEFFPWLYYARQEHDPMSHFLRQSTKDQRRSLGPFVSSTDFKTLQTALTITSADVKISLDGDTAVSKHSLLSTDIVATHVINGVYGLTFDEIDTAEVGEIDISIIVTGALVVWDKFFVVEEVVYDALFIPGALGFANAARADADLTEVLRRLPEELIGGRMQTYRYKNKGQRT